jgi:hypothetical protein
MIGELAPVAVGPVEAVTLYPVIVAPPVLAGAENETLAVVLPAEATALVGAPGTVLGVTLLLAAEALLSPAEFVALNVNVYAVPFARPVIVCDKVVVPALLSVPPAGLDVTVYPVIAAPPLSDGITKVTTAEALPLTAAGALKPLGTTTALV